LKCLLEIITADLLNTLLFQDILDKLQGAYNSWKYWKSPEFLIPPGNTGSFLDLNWSSLKFLTDGMTTKASNHKN